MVWTYAAWISGGGCDHRFCDKRGYDDRARLVMMHRRGFFRGMAFALFCATAQIYVFTGAVDTSHECHLGWQCPDSDPLRDLHEAVCRVYEES